METNPASTRTLNELGNIAQQTMKKANSSRNWRYRVFEKIMTTCLRDSGVCVLKLLGHVLD